MVNKILLIFMLASAGALSGCPCTKGIDRLCKIDTNDPRWVEQVPWSKVEPTPGITPCPSCTHDRSDQKTTGTLDDSEAEGHFPVRGMSFRYTLSDATQPVLEVTLKKDAQGNPIGEVGDPIAQTTNFSKTVTKVEVLWLDKDYKALVGDAKLQE